MDNIIFATGDEIACAFFAAIPGRLFISPIDMNADEVEAVFSDAEKTKNIEHNGTVFSGYTKIIDVVEMPYGAQVILEKEGD